MNAEQAMRIFSDILAVKGEIKNLRYISPKLIECAISALREYSEQHNPEPLTLEQLKEMVGNPVWITYIKMPHWKPTCRVIRHFGEKTEHVSFTDGSHFLFEDYGEEYAAYAHKPKEVQ